MLLVSVDWGATARKGGRGADEWNGVVMKALKGLKGLKGLKREWVAKRWEVETVQETVQRDTVLRSL